MAVAVDGGSLLEAAIAALAALISPRACVTSSGKAPPFCADVVPLDCITWLFPIGLGAHPGLSLLSRTTRPSAQNSKMFRAYVGGEHGPDIHQKYMCV